MPLSHIFPDAYAHRARPLSFRSSTDISPHATVPETATFKSTVLIHLRRAPLYIVLSFLLLIPCFWQQHIQAADLASHIYNVWLTQLIREGAAPGLWLAPQTNNILFDSLLDVLSRHLGFELAQRIAVSSIVLLLAWGCLFFLCRVSGSPPFSLLPCLAVLIYGVLFHAGFFNFYLSLGICFWYLGLFWNSALPTRLILSALLIPAWLAHPFPVVWTAGCALYVAIAQATSPRFRTALLLLAIACLLAAPLVLPYPCEWHASQIFLLTGANTAIVYGLKYVSVMIGLLVLWASLLIHRASAYSWISIVNSPQAQLCILTAAAVFLLPDAVLLPRYAVPFQFVAWSGHVTSASAESRGRPSFPIPVAHVSLRTNFSVSSRSPFVRSKT